MKLREWTPIKKAHSVNKSTEKHLDKEVICEYDGFSCRKMVEEAEGEPIPNDDDRGWKLYLDFLSKTQFTHKNIYSFVELEDGTLVGFNESPSHGWSFPVRKWKKYFTFKTEPATGPYRSFHSDYHHIKLDGNDVGRISDTKPHKVGFMVMKGEDYQDGNPNCDWRWINFKKEFDSVEDAKSWVIKNSQRIISKYNLRTDSDG